MLWRINVKEIERNQTETTSIKSRMKAKTAEAGERWPKSSNVAMKLSYQARKLRNESSNVRRRISRK